MGKALKGFKRLSVFPITTNTASTYTPGAKVAITGAQSFTANPETSEWKIYADDGIYDSGSDWLGLKFTLTLAECPLDLRQYFEGGEYTAGTGVYIFKSDDQAPEIGLSFAALLSDGSWNMVRMFSAKCSSVKMDFKSKGEGNDITPVTIEGTVMNRKTDNAVKEEKIAALSTDLTWLDTLA
jgi:phi13 family phage major tail protein